MHSNNQCGKGNGALGIEQGKCLPSGSAATRLTSTRVNAMMADK
jgi:hypothetical protein